MKVPSSASSNARRGAARSEARTRGAEGWRAAPLDQLEPESAVHNWGSGPRAERSLPSVLCGTLYLWWARRLGRGSRWRVAGGGSARRWSRNHGGMLRRRFIGGFGPDERVADRLDFGPDHQEPHRRRPRPAALPRPSRRGRRDRGGAGPAQRSAHRAGPVPDPDRAPLIRGRTGQPGPGAGCPESGCVCDQISDRLPGVGYVAVDGIAEPVRVRFSHITDQHITQLTNPPDPPALQLVDDAEGVAA